MDETTSLRKNLYASLRQALNKQALTLMDPQTDHMCGKGVELLCAMIPIYRLKWNATEKHQHQSAYMQSFRLSTQTIDEFASNIRSACQDLKWNDIQSSTDQLKKIFINGLGA